MLKANHGLKSGSNYVFCIRIWDEAVVQGSFCGSYQLRCLTSDVGS